MSTPKMKSLSFVLILSTLLVLSACQKAKDAFKQGQEDPLFHSQEFKQSLHGQRYLDARDTKVCFTCHDTVAPSSGKTDTSKKAPSCSTCHGPFPHPKDFNKSSEHGKAYLGGTIKCLTCHSSTNAEGRSSQSRKIKNCSSCHEGVPHSSEFMGTAVHGRAYLKQPSACTGCHSNREATTRGPSKITACTEWHGRFPHPNGYTARSEHGRDYVGQLTDCVMCHKKTGGNPNIPDCSVCHEVYPHAKDFKKGTNHGQTYFKAGESCTGCHGGQLQGQGYSVSCATCHTKTHSEEFKTTALHGKKDELSGKSCMECHDTSEPGSSEKRSCAICHKNYPHGSDFSDPKNHGKAFQSNRIDCLTCHKLDLKPNAENRSPTCQQCHNYPHPENWAMKQKHGVAFIESKEPGKASDPASSCYDCHDKAPKDKPTDKKISCSDCHFWHLRQGVDEDVPTGINSHIYHAKLTPYGCKGCHEEKSWTMPNYKEGCFSCHDKTKEMVVRWRDPKVEFKPKAYGRSTP